MLCLDQRNVYGQWCYGNKLDAVYMASARYLTCYSYLVMELDMELDIFCSHMLYCNPAPAVAPVLAAMGIGIANVLVPSLTYS